MNIKEFLKDHIDFIVFYFFISTLISLVIFLDSRVTVYLENLIYLNVLLFVFFSVFLLVQYVKKQKQLRDISELLDTKRIEAIEEYLKRPLSNEQNIYFKLLSKIHKENLSRVNKLYDDKKEFSDFINFWVHEIKTPIAACKLFLQREDITKEEVIDIAEEKIMSIENYVEQALYYARLDDFSNDYFIGEINVEQFIKNIIKKNARLFIGKRIGIKLENLDFTVNSDSKWLNFITEQIVLNAIKYTDKNGLIRIYGVLSDKELCIVIKDNGIGIKEEDIKRVFHKGFTGYNGRKDMKATGIGLYLSKSLANKLGHDISIESSYLEYTRVYIHFPKMIDYYISESNITKL